MALDWIRTVDHQASLFELGEWVAEHGIDADGPHRLARELLIGPGASCRSGPGKPVATPR